MKNYYFKMLVIVFVISWSTNNLFAQAETEIWKGNCGVIYDYSHELQFSVLLQKPGGTGTNKRALLNLLGKFKLESAPALKNKLVTIIAMINKAKPFKAVYGDADVTISDDLSKKIHELFDDVKIKAKRVLIAISNIISFGFNENPSLIRDIEIIKYQLIEFYN